jgi:carbon monoxide dehydrogenase subunit G
MKESAAATATASSSAAAAPPESGALVRVWMGPDGTPAGAAATARIAAPPARVWAVLSDVESWPGRVPMIHRVQRAGDRVTVGLKFKVSLFSVGFSFVADIRREGERRLELRGVSGEPKNLRLGFELAPLAGGAETSIETTGELDVMSLGWLATYFLKHHPEIQFGILPGVALSLLDSMRRAAEAKG